MATDSYPKRTEQNVIDSDGTLLISHGANENIAAFSRKITSFFANSTGIIDQFSLEWAMLCQ